MTTLATLRGYLNDELGVADGDTAVYPVALRNRAIAQGYAALYTHGVWLPVQVDVPTVQDTVFYVVSGIRRLGACYLLDDGGFPTDKVPALLEQEGASYVLTVPQADTGQTLRLVGWTAYESDFDGVATITTSSIANPTLITTAAAHGFTTGEIVTIAGHTGSTPAISGNYVATVTAPTTFTIPVSVSAGGTGGTASENDDLDAEYNRIPLLKAKAICFRKALGDYARYGQREVAPPEMGVTVDQLLSLIASTEREWEVETRALSGLRKRYGQPVRNQVL
jgi:hypothetical protein